MIATASVLVDFLNNLFAGVLSTVVAAGVLAFLARGTWRRQKRRQDEMIDALNPETPGGLGAVMERLETLEGRRK